MQTTVEYVVDARMFVVKWVNADGFFRERFFADPEAAHNFARSLSYVG